MAAQILSATFNGMKYMYELDMRLWNMYAPKAIKSNMAKSTSPAFRPGPNQWHVMSMKSEQPLDVLTVQVWLLYDQPNLITALYM